MTAGVGWGECHAPSGMCRGGSSFFASSSFCSLQTFLGLCIVPLIATWHPAPSLITSMLLSSERVSASPSPL